MPFGEPRAVGNRAADALEVLGAAIREISSLTAVVGLRRLAGAQLLRSRGSPCRQRERRRSAQVAVDKRLPLWIAAALALPLQAWAATPLPQLRDALAPFDTPQAQAQPGDWRSGHAEERQTLEQFLAQTQPLAAEQRLYVVAIGPFDAAEARALALTVDYLGLAYALPVVRLPDVGEAAVRDEWRLQGQWHAPTVLLRVVEPLRPKDAAALLAFTTADLTLGQGWNFLFGQAIPQYRVGIWSLHRLGDADPAVALRRTLVVATHETGHMLGLDHCAGPRCLMNGANHLGELDGTPLLPCADDAARLLWRLPVQPQAQAQALAAFLRAHRLEDDAAGWQKRAESLGLLGAVELPLRPTPTDQPAPRPQLAPLPPPVPRLAPQKSPADWAAWLVVGGYLAGAIGFFVWAARRQRRGIEP